LPFDAVCAALRSAEKQAEAEHEIKAAS